MKKRAVRRWQQHVARVRAQRFLWNNFTSDHVRRKPWRALNQIGAYLHRDPGSWLHIYVTRPARARSNRLLHQIERGFDPECLPGWPDYRKPHVYFW